MAEVSEVITRQISIPGKIAGRMKMVDGDPKVYQELTGVTVFANSS